MTLNKKGVFTEKIKYDEMHNRIEDGKNIWLVYRGNKHIATINVTDKVIFH